MSSSVQEPQTGSVWSHVSDCVVPPVSAAVAIVPAYYGFVAKSFLQRGLPIPAMTAREVLYGGLGAAPPIGGIVGGQLLMQGRVEKRVAEWFNQGTPQSEFGCKLLSAMLVGGLSAPGFVVFNSYTMKEKEETMKQVFVKALQGLSAKQVAAIVAREGTFLFSLGISVPLCKKVRETVGENKTAEYSTAFMSGVVASVCGHPADTALTLWQKNLRVEGLRQLMRGSAHKAVAVGVFSVVYKCVSEGLTPSRVVEK